MVSDIKQIHAVMLDQIDQCRSQDRLYFFMDLTVPEKSTDHSKSSFLMEYIAIMAHTCQICDMPHTIYRKFG